MLSFSHSRTLVFFDVPRPTKHVNFSRQLGYVIAFVDELLELRQLRVLVVMPLRRKDATVCSQLRM